MAARLIRLHGTPAMFWEADAPIIFTIRLDDEPLGTLDIWGGDDGMGVVYGACTPLPGYATTQPFFRRFTMASYPNAAAADAALLDHWFAERDALNLSVTTQQELLVPVEWVMIHDFPEERPQGAPYEGLFCVGMGFFDNPLLWPARPRFP